LNIVHRYALLCGDERGDRLFKGAEGVDAKLVRRGSSEKLASLHTLITLPHLKCELSTERLYGFSALGKGTVDSSRVITKVLRRRHP
jgi:hypothetical protein